MFTLIFYYTYFTSNINIHISNSANYKINLYFHRCKVMIIRL